MSRRIRIDLDASALDAVLKAGGSARQDVAVEVHDTALVAFAQSQMEVPLDKGTLMGSGMVEGPTFKGDGVEVAISYGGPASQYALKVHEGVGMRFQNGRKAKYLVDPVERSVVGLSRRIADRLGRRLGGR